MGGIMGKKKQIASSIIAGTLFAVAWWLLIDGVIVGKVHQAPQFLWYFYMPSVVASIAPVLSNLVNPNDVNGEGGLFSDGQEKKVRIWLFFTFILSFASICFSIWITVDYYAPKKTPTQWPGISSILNTSFIMVSSFIMLFGRKGDDDYMM